MYFYGTRNVNRTKLHEYFLRHRHYVVVRNHRCRTLSYHERNHDVSVEIETFRKDERHRDKRKKKEKKTDASQRTWRLAKGFSRENFVGRWESLTTINSNADSCRQYRARSLNSYVTPSAICTSPRANYSACSTARSDVSLGMIHHGWSFVRLGEGQEGERERGRQTAGPVLWNSRREW